MIESEGLFCLSTWKLNKGGFFEQTFSYLPAEKGITLCDSLL